MSAPKSTSVPATVRLAATRALGLRFFARSGVHSAMRSRSSVNSISSKSGCSARAATRFFRYSMFALPLTKVMCGAVLMKLCGSGNAPCSTRYDQYCRLTWNCSLIETALSALTVPSGFSGM